ncbi:MAG: hypothetical protein DRP08_08000 [Candidatus Aenigmatarchaeota archaeon]|nr:MAG: hypothetical protein DRP08_08000 [Candidatus Aenigmarchaeota archaeon]
MDANLLKGGVKGFGVGTFLGVLGYVVGAIGDLYVPGISETVGAAVGFLAGLLIGLGDALKE